MYLNKLKLGNLKTFSTSLWYPETIFGWICHRLQKSSVFLSTRNSTLSNIIFVYRFWAHYHLSTEVYAGYSYGNILFTWRIRKCLLCLSPACHGHFNCIISFCCCWSDCQYCWPNFADCFRENTGPWIENILMLTTKLPNMQKYAIVYNGRFVPTLEQPVGAWDAVYAARSSRKKVNKAGL